MKSVLISIQPKWCELICKCIGSDNQRPQYKKRLELRKTAPKPPFKCYIYCTKSRKPYESFGVSGKPFECGGKVIAEFVCDRVQEYESEFVDDDCFEMIASIDRDEEDDATGFFEWSNDSEIPYISTDFYQKCCVPYGELKKYMGLGFSTFYGWHISDLVIYDKPKELSEFCRYDNTYDNAFGYAFEDRNKYIPITRPPQSWCYVDHPTEKGGVQE